MWVFWDRCFFFDPSSNLRTPPQMSQEDLGMVEKQSGSKGRKLLEKAGIRGEVAGGIFRRPNKKRPNFIPIKTTKISQLSNCTKKKGGNFPHLTVVVFRLHEAGLLDKKTPIDLMHLWTFGSSISSSVRSNVSQSIGNTLRPRSRKLMDLCTWDSYEKTRLWNIRINKNCQHLNLSANRNLDFCFFHHQQLTVNVYFIFTSPCFFFF